MEFSYHVKWSELQVKHMSDICDPHSYLINSKSWPKIETSQTELSLCKNYCILMWYFNKVFLFLFMFCLVVQSLTHHMLRVGTMEPPFQGVRS